MKNKLITFINGITFLIAAIMIVLSVFMLMDNGFSISYLLILLFGILTVWDMLDSTFFQISKRKKTKVDRYWLFTWENFNQGIPGWIDTDYVSFTADGSNLSCRIAYGQLTINVKYGQYIILIDGMFMYCPKDRISEVAK